MKKNISEVSEVELTHTAIDMAPPLPSASYQKYNLKPVAGEEKTEAIVKSHAAGR